jgi:hypothetical protein
MEVYRAWFQRCVLQSAKPAPWRRYLSSVVLFSGEQVTRITEDKSWTWQLPGPKQLLDLVKNQWNLQVALHGESGCGKSETAYQLAAHHGCCIVELACPSDVSKLSESWGQVAAIAMAASQRMVVLLPELGEVAKAATKMPEGTLMWAAVLELLSRLQRQHNLLMITTLNDIHDLPPVLSDNNRFSTKIRFSRPTPDDIGYIVDATVPVQLQSRWETVRTACIAALTAQGMTNTPATPAAPLLAVPLLASPHRARRAGTGSPESTPGILSPVSSTSKEVAARPPVYRVPMSIKSFKTWLNTRADMIEALSTPQWPTNLFNFIHAQATE